MKRKIAFTFVLILLTGISACNLPGIRPDQDVPDNGSDDQQPPAGVATNTPEFTLTPSNTPLPTFTFTPEVPMVSVSVETNCRTGPGEPYDIVGVLHVGETAEVVGRAPYGGSWIIKNPDGAGTCWLWDYYATVTGNTQGLPVADIPPTPTPAAGFTVAYLSTPTCAGMYGFRFQLVNNGSVTWNSYKIDITDSTTATSTTYSDDYFTDYTGCGPFVDQLQDLEPGESGVTGNWDAGLLFYNPAGHNITATFTLCSQNGLAGECTTKSISFTP
ncbi:MAG: hypothetical protein HY781_02375 [Chloroflexi bacterium]|nr:hypothetical protein [Chloroflexota bacterium]